MNNKDLLKTRQDQLIQEFKKFKSWEERYRYLIEIGKELPALPEEYKQEKFKIKGCQSQVWLFAQIKQDKRIELIADSDALIVKGLIAMLLRIYSDATAEEILKTPPDFISELSLLSHLSPSRSNGLYAMIKQIYYYAAVLKEMLKTSTTQ